MPLVISFALVFFNNTKYPLLLQPYLAHALYPIHNSVDAPFRWVLQTKGLFQDRTLLLSENADLKEQQHYYQAQLQQLQSLESENQALRELLGAKRQYKEGFIEAEALYTTTDPFKHQVWVNKGENAGVRIGQPVIDAKGLVGVVLSVDKHRARVLLLTDSEFAVPVQSLRSAERAIAKGSGNRTQLRLSYVPRTGDFVEGDQLITSGMDGRFPSGYAVGVITSIQHDPGTRFTLIEITPNAQLGKLRHVLLMKGAEQEK